MGPEIVRLVRRRAFGLVRRRALVADRVFSDPRPQPRIGRHVPVVELGRGGGGRGYGEEENLENGSGEGGGGYLWAVRTMVPEAGRNQVFTSLRHPVLFTIVYAHRLFQPA